MVTSGSNIKLYVRASHYDLSTKSLQTRFAAMARTCQAFYLKSGGSRRPPRKRWSICHHGRATASVGIFSPVYTQLKFSRVAGQIRPPLPRYERRSTTGHRRHQTTNLTASSTGQGDTFLSVYSSEDHLSSDLYDGSRQGTDKSASPTALEPKRAPLKINQDILIHQAAKIRNKGLKLRNKDERVRYRFDALRIYQRARALDPRDGRAYVGMGQVLRQLGEYDAARRCYQDGCDATGGENAYIWQAWGTLEAEEGNVSRARQLYDAATAADKTHAAAWHAWGMFEKSQGNYQRARDLFVKGMRMVPHPRANPHLYQSLGVMAMERGRIQEAREHFKEGTKTEAGARSAALWQAWAILESREGNSDQARKLFQCGLVVDPNNRYVWLSWAVFEARQGFADRARSLLTRGCKLNPGDPPLLQALARLEAAEGNMTTARILFEQGTKLDPLHQANWQAWALAEWKHGDIDYARELLQRGVWVSPRSKNASKLFQAWGVLEERDGNVALARQLYKCGIRADPTSEITWLTWALMEEKQGNDVRAGELRNLCVQQRAEEAVGQSDLSPAAMFGIDSALRPVLRSLATLLGNQLPTQESANRYSGCKELELSDKEIQQAEPLFGVSSPKDS